MAKRIMVVDDEPSVLRPIARLLENDGYEVITSRSGQECLAKLKGGEIVDLIILDNRYAYARDGWSSCM
jgi:CheY-like chemotaxis protein